jgi:hypothetical protein
MKKLKISIWIISIVIWIAALIILIKAITDGSPENPMKQYRLVIGIGFIALTGFLRIVYKETTKLDG